MAKKKADLEGAALGFLLGASPADGATVANTGDDANTGDAAPVADTGNTSDDAPDTADGYARTSTGYRRGSGETVRRVSLFLTERQRRDLRRLAAGSENVTEYVVEALGLGHPTPGPRRGV